MAGLASTNDRAEATIFFGETGEGVYACAVEDGPDSGVLVGKDGVVVVDSHAVATMAWNVMDGSGAVTDHKVTQAVCSRYRAVRMPGITDAGACGRVLVAPVRTARGEWPGTARHPLRHGRSGRPRFHWPVVLHHRLAFEVSCARSGAQRIGARR